MVIAVNLSFSSQALNNVLAFFQFIGKLGEGKKKDPGNEVGVKAYAIIQEVRLFLKN